MKNKILNMPVLLIVMFAASFSIILACKKNTEPQALNIQKARVNTQEYLANLRAYKKSDHAIAFGWFGSSGGASSNGQKYSGIPDSVDIVSLWGGFPNAEGWVDLHKVQEQKATKFVMVVFDDSKFLNNWSKEKDFAATYDKGDDQLLIGFNKIAQNLRDTISKYQLNGLDLDHEPNVCGCDWGLLKDSRKYSMFLAVLSIYFGPLSTTDKLLIVDGEYSMITSAAAKGLDYIVSQAYYTTSPSSLQNRYNTVPAGFPTTKFVVTEDFERSWATGGSTYTDPVRGTMPSLLGMAYWNPTQGRKGGMGAYHIEYEFPADPDYKYLRQAIQIQNPAVK